MRTSNESSLSAALSLIVPLFRHPNDPAYTWANVSENKHVESFDLQTEEWSSEAPFPFDPVGRCTNIPYGNSFLSIGGTKSGDESVDYIYTVSETFNQVVSKLLF